MIIVDLAGNFWGLAGHSTGNQRNDGLRYWAGGLLLSALAHTLLLLYGRPPNLLTVVLGNALLSSAFAGFLAGGAPLSWLGTALGPHAGTARRHRGTHVAVYNTSLPAVWSSVGSR